MSDLQGNGRKKKRENVSIADAGSAHSPQIVKKIKLEEPSPHEANPNSIDAVRERNKALELDLQEKNRRIARLTSKCEELFRSRAIAQASLQCVRRFTSQLMDDLRVTTSSLTETFESGENCCMWRKALDASNPFENVSFKGELHAFLPQWFVSIGCTESSKSTSKAEQTEPNSAPPVELNGCFQQELDNQRNEIKTMVVKILELIHNDKKNEETKPLELSRLLEERRTAVAEILALKDELELSKTHTKELKKDLEEMEIERHRACRDYDRLQRLVDESSVKLSETADDESDQQVTSAGANSLGDETREEMDEEAAKSSKLVAALKENMQILSSKLYAERRLTESLKNEVEELKASEVVLHSEEKSLRQHLEEQLEKLREEKSNIGEALSKMRHKSKDIENHMHDKWKKKVLRFQADLSKTKSQVDELSVKNTQLKEKLFTHSTFRDQLMELKSSFAVLEREKANLKTLLDKERTRNARLDQVAEQKSVKALEVKLASLSQANEELKKALDEVKREDRQTMVRSLKDLSDKLERVRDEANQHKIQAEAAKLDVAHHKQMTLDLKEENNALITEIEAINKEMENVRHSRKKLVQQVDEKRNQVKKLHTQLAKEEQSKAHCFEELAAARLQASSLSSVHKQQAATLEGIREKLAAKEKELEELNILLKNMENENAEAEAERRKAISEAEKSRLLLSNCSAEYSRMQKTLLQEKPPCDECDDLKMRLNKAVKERQQLQQQMQQQQHQQHAKDCRGTSGAGGMADELTQLELTDLRKVVKCSVCRDGRKNVILSKCFHMFCKDCIDSNLKARNRKCPTCKRMFGQDDVKSVWWT